MTDAAGGARGSARRQDVRTVLRRAATAASWAPAPTRPGFGSRLCPRVQRSPPGAPGRRGREGPGLCAQVLRVPQCACVRAEPCVCSDTEPTPDLPLRPASAPSARRLEARLGSRSVTPATGTCRSFPGAPQSGGLCPGIRCEPGAPTGVGGRPAGPPGHPGMADQAGVTLGSPGAHTWSSRPPWSPHISDRVDCCALAFGEKAPSPTKEGHGGGGRTVWDQRWVPCLALGSLCDPKVTLPHTVHCFLTNTMVAPRACPGSPISCPQGSG